MIYVNYRYQGETTTVAEYPTLAEAHRHIRHYYNELRLIPLYTSNRSTKDWREQIEVDHEP